MESSNAITQELKTAIARALVDPSRENILASLDAQHNATPPVAVDVLRSLPSDQQLRYRELVGAFWRASARALSEGFVFELRDPADRQGTQDGRERCACGRRGRPHFGASDGRTDGERSASPHSEDAEAVAGDDRHLREDVTKVDEPQLRAMFETSAEVLVGLKKAFSDYEQKDEAAWRK